MNHELEDDEIDLRYVKKTRRKRRTSPSTVLSIRIDQEVIDQLEDLGIDKAKLFKVFCTKIISKHKK